MRKGAALISRVAPIACGQGRREVHETRHNKAHRGGENTARVKPDKHSTVNTQTGSDTIMTSAVIDSRCVCESRW